MLGFRQMQMVTSPVFRFAVGFLKGRLERQESVEWALGLRDDQYEERAAIERVREAEQASLREPWKSVWQLIEESWIRRPAMRVDEATAYGIRRRLHDGEYSGATIEALVDLVRPRVEVDSLKGWRASEEEQRRRPRSVHDVIRVNLTSGPIVDLSVVELGKVEDLSFLIELAEALDAALGKGLAIGRRIGWTGGSNFWRLGGLHRAYFVADHQREPDDHEPDLFHKGIAPVVKLTHAVVARLADIDVNKTLRFVSNWRNADSPVQIRLWAAMARSPSVVSTSDVAEFLKNCDLEMFWDARTYPEIAEMRALRFAALDASDQEHVIRRIREFPPRRLWRGESDRTKINQYRAYWAVRELRRIEAGGGVVPPPVSTWLATQIEQFEVFRAVPRIDVDFPESPRASWIPPDPNRVFDTMSGIERLEVLERDLSSAARGRISDPATRAADWLQQPGNADLVLNDLAAAPNAGGDYPRSWNRVTWMHRPQSDKASEGESGERSQKLAARVLDLLRQVPEHTARDAADGISSWLDAWARQDLDRTLLTEVWLRLWPSAADVTNAQQDRDDALDLNLVVKGVEDQEPEDLDTLNCPAGRFVGVFLSLCPSVKRGDRPFETDINLRRIRDVVIATEGRAGLIGRYRCIEALPYFMLADSDWAQAQLISKLLQDSDEAVILWRAAARRTQTPEAMSKIGLAMVDRATDSRLGRRTRERLVWNVCVATLHSLQTGDPPPVDNARVTQMLRSIDDEIRAHAARTVRQFVNEVAESSKQASVPVTPEAVFRMAARPFISMVWPQEVTLASAGIAHAFAALPAASCEEFVAAVDTVERFLAPFDCWALHDYGFDEGDNARIEKIIDSPAKAEALLRLLDRTIGQTDNSIAPLDLAQAVEHVAAVAPRLIESRIFRRLSVLTRR